MSKKAQEAVDLSTLPPWFPLTLFLNWECSEQNATSLAKAVYESTFTIKKSITREDIIEFGKRTAMYVDPANDKAKKDKKTADVPTELTSQLMAEMYVKYLEELNLEGRKEKKLKLEGKEVPQTKRPDAKAAAAGQKGGAAKKPPAGAPAEEVKEEPPLDTFLKKDCDFVYFLQDYPSTKDEIVELSKQGAGIDLLLRVKEKVIEHKSFEESELLGKRDDDGEALRERYDTFMEKNDSLARTGQEGTDEKGKREKEEKLLRDKEYINRNLQVVNDFKAAREESAMTEVIRNMVLKEVVCEFDEEVPIEETLRNAIMSIFEEICNHSQDMTQFKAWLVNKKSFPIKQPVKATPPPPPVEATIPQEDTMKSAKGAAPKAAAGKDAKKEGKDDKKKPGQAKAEEEVKKEESIVKPEPSKVEEKELEFNFKYYEKQLNPVKEEHLTPGALIEAMVDEISHNSKNAKGTVDITRDEIENMFRGFNDDVLRSLSIIRPAAAEAVLNNSDMGSSYHNIINEADVIALKSQSDQFSTQEALEVREHATFDRLKIPGFDRFEMPIIPDKSEPVRKAEKSQIHPFLSFEVTDYERFQLIELLEKVFKEKTTREWNFGDRIFEERSDTNILRQKLYQALIFDPETYSQYFDQDDALLLGVYFKNPPGRVIRKKWTCPWKVLPNAENWILHFKDNENNLNNNLFYNLDYRLVENLREIIKFMYPNDNSVIMCSQFTVGEKSLNFYRVLKENFIFGIRKSSNPDNKNSELWAVFENRTKLLVEIENLTKNLERRNSAQPKYEPKLDEIVVPDEEKDAQASARQQQDAQTEQSGEFSRPVTGAQPDIFGSTFTLTLENGLIVKFLTNGDILQTISKSKKQKEGKYFDEIIKEQYVKEELAEQERSRLITGKGSVVRYMKDGSVQILYANGNYAFYKKNSGTWITTNNKGLRKGRRVRDNSEFELDAIPSAKKTDPETGCKILIREDKVMVIQYPDGSIYTTHKDGTRFLTSADSNNIIIEHDSFATVKIKYDPIKARMGTIIAKGTSTAYQGFENIMDRSFDGRVTETFLPDGSRVIGYKEKRELDTPHEAYETSNIHLLYEPEGSVLRFRSDGEVILISANDRYELNEKGENRKDKDIDYFLQLFGGPEDRKNGVYTAELAQNIIKTRDNEGNEFSISSSGEARGKIAVSINLEQNPNEPEKPLPQDIPDGLYMDEENTHLPPPEKVLPPRLFVIKNNNTGSEYLNDFQLKHYFRIKEQDPKCHKIVEDTVPGFHNCQSLTFLTSFSNYDKDRMKHIFVKIPSNVDIIPQTQPIRDEPLQLKFLYRNLIKFVELDESNRQKLHEDLDRFVEWKKNQDKEAREFGVKERSEEQKEKEYSIQQKIIESRRTNVQHQNYSDCLAKVAQDTFPDVFKNTKNKLIASRKRKDSEVVIVKTRKSITKQYLPLQEPPILPEAIYPLNIKFSEVDWRDVDFAGNYYQSYPGLQFEKTLPKYDVKAILSEKEKLRKTKELMKEDATLTNGGRKYSLPRSNPEPATNSPSPPKKELTHKSPTFMKMTISPSWNVTRDKLEREREVREATEARDYHHSKSQQYTLTGDIRTQTEQVPSLLRPIAARELNTKHITVESATEKIIRTSSMANRLNFHAPSIAENRKQGTHELLKLSMDKRYNRESLEEKKDLKVTASFADALKKNLWINPVAINFGKVRFGKVYERMVKIKNEDPMPQRIGLEQSSLKYLTVKQKELGTLALGVPKDIIVTLDAKKDYMGPFDTEFKIKSGHDIYRIHVKGEISDEAFVEGERPRTKSKLPPLNSDTGSGRLKAHDISTDSKMSSEDQSFPNLKYDRNTRLEINLNSKKKLDDSDQFDTGNM